MRHHRSFPRPPATAVGLAGVVLAGLLAAPAPAGAARHLFVHTATASNTFLDTTTIDYPPINGDPEAVVIVTQVWNPGGGPGIYNAHEIGVSYSSTTGRWSIYNQDFAAMPLGASFNVWVGMRVAGGSFLHTATAGNTVAATTFLDHPGLNGCPFANLQVTHYRNPGGGSGPRNDHPIALIYSTPAEQWTIHNQDSLSFALGAAFNVFTATLCASLDFEPDHYYFATHVASEANTMGHISFIDLSAANSLPHAFVVATINASFPAPLVPHPFGVFYESTTERWAIFNQDIAPIPLGATFNLLIVDLLFADGFENGDAGAWSSMVP